MVREMKQEIEGILRNYLEYRQSRPFRGPHTISELFVTLRDETSQLPFVQENQNLIVKSSYGKGNWAAVPWLAMQSS
jgi:hypothetical protein